MEDPGCINSITVQSINIERGEDAVLAPSCYFDSSVSGTPILGDKKVIKNLAQIIETFERNLRNNSLFYKPNSLKVVINDSAKFQITPSKIQMSYAQAKDLKFFKKALTKSWFMNFASKSLKADEFSQELLSDIFLYAFWNELSWVKETNHKRWLKYVYSSKDLCSSIYVPTVTPDVCTVKNEQLTAWSIRPLMLNRIVDYYDQMDLSQKIEFTKYWVKLAATFDSNLRKEKIDFTNFSKIFNSRMNAMVSPLMNMKFDDHLGIDFVFDFRIKGIRTENFENPFYMLKNIIFKMSDGSYVNLRSGSKIKTDKIYSRHWVLVQNEFPELKEVKNISADYLTIIQAKKEYDLTQFYKKMDDISSFPWVDEFDSLTIYIPSLRLLGRLAPKEVEGVDIRSLSLNPKITKILGWNPVQVY